MRSARTTARSRTTARAGSMAAALLAASLVLTGCGAGADSTGDEKADLSAAKPADGSAADAGRGAADGSSGAAAPTAKVPAPQHVIRTASLSVEVADVTKALATARQVAADAGGRIENETTERVDDASVTSHLVLRVPQERYDSVLTGLAGTGRLLARKADAKDVTEQVVDVESRVATQRASVARVRALMQRAERLADVVTLEGELSRRQADLESLLAQQASLKDRTSLATITLDLTEKAKPSAAAEEDGRPGFGEALGGGWNALVAAVAWLGVVLAALAPWLAVALVGFVLWRRLVRPRLAARAAARAAERPATAQVPRPGQPVPVRNAAGVSPAPEPPELSGK
ncbi:DUF4349 domain-containing protein [Streptomyces sp. NPDC059491]|uniref:DUF4349 domain-containing protein n=1 Tax=Streptomyces sp. NPDC059491 TaxID=3346850 RepID=UPI0036778B0D